MAPCCDRSQCPGGVVELCADGVRTGVPGEAHGDDDGCPDEPTILTLPNDTFYTCLGILVGSMLLVSCCTHQFSRRYGQRQALRDYVRQLQLAGMGPVAGSEVAALARIDMLSDLPEPEISTSTRVARPMDDELPLFQPVAAVRRATQPARAAAAQPPASRSAASSVMGPAAQVGAPLLQLHGVQADEAELVPMSPLQDRAASQGAGVRPASRAGSLAARQTEESELVPPSTAGGSVAGGAPPPTPPRAGFKNRKGAGAIGLTLPDEQGRWASVGYSSSMQNSPVGSCGHPSLAPSESVYGGAMSVGGRSRRSGCFSVREGSDEASNSS